ncbi:hypothetical protein L53_02430 [Hyphomonas sp. L-53-1-40]|nr:hypothetical protein L53_02430 [Hyphomonas sp. L-53-1-40]
MSVIAIAVLMFFIIGPPAEFEVDPLPMVRYHKPMVMSNRSGPEIKSPPSKDGGRAFVTLE